MTEVSLDENGRDARYEDWMWGCRHQFDEPKGPDGVHAASNGERVTTALALEIAADILHQVLEGDEKVKWTDDDIRHALAAIAGVRMQGGCEEYDPCITDGMLTHLCDLVVYG